MAEAKPIPGQTGELLARLERQGVRLGLEPLRALLARLDDPQLVVPTVLVAGTNGKGSVAAMLAGIGCAAGLVTGLYTSPHLEDYRERLRVDGQAIAPVPFAALLDEVVAAAPTLPTCFEALTAAAFLWFARQRLDLAVLEVGLGGRLDATNSAEPELSVITPIALDHRELLGETLALIAGEKAGILRRDRPAVAWTEPAEVGRALRTAAERIGSPLREIPATVEITAAEAVDTSRQAWVDAAAGTLLRCRTALGSYAFRLPFAGAHQRGNGALAIAAAEELYRLGRRAVTAEAIVAGVEGTRWPGRLETVALPSGARVVLDGAHNPAGAEALAAHLRASGAPFDLLFGVLADKDAPGMLAPLAPLARRLVATMPPSPRALGATAIAALAGRPVLAIDDLDAALTAALDAAPGQLVVAGSLFLVGAVRRLLGARFGVPRPAAETPTWDPAGPAAAALAPQPSGS